MSRTAVSINALTLLILCCEAPMPHEFNTRQASQIVTIDILSGNVLRTVPFTWTNETGPQWVQFLVAYGTETIPASGAGDDQATFIVEATFPGSTNALSFQFMAVPSQGSLTGGAAAIPDPDTTITITALSDDWVSLGGSDYRLTVPMDFTANFNNVTGTLQRAPILSTVKNATWTGNFVVNLFTGSSPGSPTITSAALRSIEVDEFGAWEGAPAHVGRTLRDQKTGLPLGSHELVEDGYLKGVWTADSQWDPDDPRNERPTRLPSTEGERGDDVPL